MLELDDLAHVLEEPRIDPRERGDLRRGHPVPERVADGEHAVGIGHAQQATQLFLGDGAVERQRPAILLQRAHRLLQRLLERAPDGHDLTDRLHLGRQRAVGLGELLEGPAREFHDAVVDGRLERRRRLARDVVAHLVEAVAHRELGGDLGDRKAGGLGGQRGGSRHARVHLDDDQAAVVGVHRELDVRAAGLDADLADDLDRGVAHQLVFLVRQRLRRGDRDRVAGVHAHGIDVLDRADDDDVVGEVTHDLELEFLPADHRLLDQHGPERRHLQAPAHGFVQLVGVVGDRAAGAAERERGADDRRIAGGAHDVLGLVRRARVAGARQREADGLDGALEELAVLRLADGGDLGADQLDAEALERAVVGERDGQVERRLTAQGGQQRLRPLALDDLGHELRREGLDVGARRHLGIGHDGGRVAVHEDDLVAFLAQRPAALGARVVELAGLADDDRPRADDHDLPQIGPLRHPLLFHEPVDDRGVRRRFLALVEHVVDAAGPDPDRLTVAPQLLAQHAHAALDALLDGVRLQRGLALRRERRPLGLLSRALDLPVRDQIFRHVSLRLRGIRCVKPSGP